VNRCACSPRAKLVAKTTRELVEQPAREVAPARTDAEIAFADTFYPSAAARSAGNAARQDAIGS